MSPPWGEQAGRIHLLSSEENGQNKFLRAYQALTSSYWSDHQTRSDPSLLTDVLSGLSESPSEPSRSQVLSPAARLDWIWTVVVFKRDASELDLVISITSSLHDGFISLHHIHISVCDYQSFPEWLFRHWDIIRSTRTRMKLIQILVWLERYLHCV